MKKTGIAAFILMLALLAACGKQDGVAAAFPPEEPAGAAYIDKQEILAEEYKEKGIVVCYPQPAEFKSLSSLKQAVSEAKALAENQNTIDSWYRLDLLRFIPEFSALPEGAVFDRVTIREGYVNIRYIPQTADPDIYFDEGLSIDWDRYYKISNFTDAQQMAQTFVRYIAGQSGASYEAIQLYGLPAAKRDVLTAEGAYKGVKFYFVKDDYCFTVYVPSWVDDSFLDSACNIQPYLLDET